MYFYLWFIPDVMCAGLFTLAMMFAFQHLVKIHYGETIHVLKDMFPPLRDESKNRCSVYYFGTFPLSYASWLFYSSILLAKIWLLVHYDILYRLNPGVGMMGQQFLLVIASFAGFTFFFLVEGHTWASRYSHRYVFVTLICAWTALEMVDTVTLLSLLYVYHSQEEGDDNALDNVVIALVMISFFLPTIHLYMLSMTDRSAEVLELPVATLGDVLHLLLVDVPYLGVRGFLVSKGDYTVVVLMLKNVFFIIFMLRHIVPDCRETLHRLWLEQKALRVRRKLARMNKEQRESYLSTKSGRKSARSVLAHSRRASGRTSGMTRESETIFTAEDFAHARKARRDEEEILRLLRARHDHHKQEKLERKRKNQRSKATQTIALPSGPKVEPRLSTNKRPEVKAQPE